MPPASRPSPFCSESTALVRIAAIVLVIGVAACASRSRAPIEDRSARPAPPAAAAVAPAPETAAPVESETRPQTYTVKRGDTLHAIALDHGLDYRELAAWNNLENPNRISVGQVLRIAPPGDAASSTGVQTMPLRPLPPVQAGDATAAAAPALSAPSGARNTETYKTQPKALKEPYSEHALRDLQRAGGAMAAVASVPAEVAPPSVAIVPEARATPKPANVAADDGQKLDWAWPAKGRIVASFSEATTLKGIDIAGSAGQPVTASAGGKVVYAGSGLRGYGKLIIIKHNDSYLSAYAHNRDILVKEGQQVVKGQKIAEMGNTDADQVKLHFEIRRQGKPVDPLRYLPPA
jgi:lipoprotein NlpD